MGAESRFTPEQRRDIVLAILEGPATMAEICREHQVSTTAVYRWKDQFLEGGLAALQGKGPSQREKEQQEQLLRVREIVGELALANYALKGGRAVSTGKRRGRVSDGL